MTEKVIFDRQKPTLHATINTWQVGSQTREKDPPRNEIGPDKTRINFTEVVHSAIKGLLTATH